MSFRPYNQRFNNNYNDYDKNGMNNRNYDRSNESIHDSRDSNQKNYDMHNYDHRHKGYVDSCRRSPGVMNRSNDIPPFIPQRDNNAIDHHIDGRDLRHREHITSRSDKNEYFPMNSERFEPRADKFVAQRDRDEKKLGLMHQRQFRNERAESDVNPFERNIGLPQGTHMNMQNGPPQADLIASLKTISQVGIHEQNDIATKIISAVLSSVPNLGPMSSLNVNAPAPMLSQGFQEHPNFQGGPGGIHGFSAGPGRDPNFPIGVGENPNFQFGPGGNQNFTDGPSANFDRGPDRNSRFQGDSGVNPFLEDECQRNYNSYGTPRDNPEFQDNPIGNPYNQWNSGRNWSSESSHRAQRDYGRNDLRDHLNEHNAVQEKARYDGPTNLMNDNFNKGRPFQPHQSFRPRISDSFQDRIPKENFRSKNLPKFRGRVNEGAQDKPRIEEKSKGDRVSKKRTLSGEGSENDSKRGRKSNVDLGKSGESSLPEVKIEKDKSTVTKTENGKIDKGKSEMKELPPEALHCHICNQGHFASEKTYLFHLEKVKHKKTAIIFREKNEVVLEYLRINAKLADIRTGAHSKNVKTSTPFKCNSCLCTVSDGIKNHKRLVEHRLVCRFLFPKCCDRTFKSKYDVDQHQLSLPHLRRVYEAKCASEANNEGNESDDKKGVLDAIKLQINANREEDDLCELTLPPFDGNTMIGITFLQEKNSVLCRVCSSYVSLGPGIESIESHLLSSSHYDAVVQHVIKQKQKKTLTADSSPEVAKVKTEEITKTKFNRERESEDESEDDLDDCDLPTIDHADDIILEEIGDDYVSKSFDEDEVQMVDNEEAEK